MIMNKYHELTWQMLEPLLQMDALQWGMYTLSQDPLYGRISRENRVRIITQAQKTGREMARQIKERWQTADPAVLCRCLGAQLRQMPGEEACGIYIFAQFEEPDVIYVASDMLARAEEAARLAFPQLSRIPAEQLLLAHEIYHLLEFRMPALDTCTATAPVWQWGKVKWNRRIRSASEIGAMAFAQALTGIEYSPQLLDILLIYGRDPAGAAALADRILAQYNGEME